MRRTSLLGLASMVAVAAGGLAGIGGATVVLGTDAAAGLSAQTTRQMAEQGTKPAPGDKRSTDMRGMLGSGYGGSGSAWRRAGYGWTNMHQKRVARKKRNKARHRAACKG